MQHKFYRLCYSTVVLLIITHCQQPHPTPNTINQTCDNTQSLPKSECEALLDLYEFTAGSKWLRADGWAELADPCLTAHGVSCTDGHVIELRLSSNRLQGSIPSSITQLTHLQRLDLSDNSLAGNIPVRIGELSQLQELFLNHNQLEGLLPNSLADLTQLKLLRLSNNKLVGPIPTSLTALTALTQFWFMNTELVVLDAPELGRWLKRVQDSEWGEAMTLTANDSAERKLDFPNCQTTDQTEALTANAMAELLRHPQASSLSEEAVSDAFLYATTSNERKISFPYPVNVTVHWGEAAAVLFTVRIQCFPGGHYSTPHHLYVFNGRNHYTYLQQIGSAQPQKVYATPNGWLLLVSYATSSTSGDSTYGVLHVYKSANIDTWSIEEIVHLPFDRRQQDMVLSEDGQELLVMYEETNRQRPCRFNETLHASSTQTTYHHEQLYQRQISGYYELLYETTDVLEVKAAVPGRGLSLLENWQAFCLADS